MTAEIASASPTPYQLLPRLTDEEFSALKADIEANGIRVPIDVDETGTVIDGHHRAWIAADLGIDCPRRVVSGLSDEKKRAHAIAANVYRRNLSRDQRQLTVRRLRDLGMSTRQIADVAQVSHMTVSRDAERPVTEVTPHTPAPIVGADGKTYQPQTVEQRRELAKELRTRGMSIAEVAETMGVAKSTAQSLLAARKVDAPAKSPANTPGKVERIRELAAKGWRASQIARDLGHGEQWVKELARTNGIEITADKAVGRTRSVAAAAVEVINSGRGGKKLPGWFREDVA